MSEAEKKIELEIVHVLFLDIVGYSKLRSEEQHAAIDHLNQIVRTSDEFQRAEAADRLIKIPTGDGMSLVFYKSPEQPVECALEITRILKTHPEIPVRMGVHSGPISAVTDLNGRTNVAGIGMNIAQRVMDCGDAGHILLSKRVAEDLEQYGLWQTRLHDLGEVEVKHGLRIHVFNLHTEELGNPEVPNIFQRQRTSRAAAEAVDAKSLVVLPLANQSGDPSQGYFADGLTEELINTLGRIRPLHVIGRNSSFAFKDRTEDSRAIGQKLGVANLLEGSVRKAGDRVRISVGLVRAMDGSQLWTQTYDRELKDIFAVQEEIARAIGDQLCATILGDTETSDRMRQTENVETAESYRLYFRGRYQWGKRTEAGLRAAVANFKEAIDLDPDNARAWAGLADCYAVLGCWGYEPPHQSYPKARAAAEKALDLNETLSEAHVSLAVAKKDYYWDWAGAEQAYQRALELNPSNATAHHWYAECLACLGRHEEAIAQCERARALDPLSLIVATVLARHGYCFARQYDRAIKELREIVRTDPEFWVAQLFLGFSYVYTGQFDEALAAFMKAKRLETNGDMLAGIGYALARSNQTAEARRVLAEAENLSQERYVQPVALAVIHTGLGENEEAFSCLAKAYEERAQWLSEIKVEPAFDSLRSDPRFAQLLRQLGLE